MISPFTPIRFYPLSTYQPDGYVQMFAPSDHILIQRIENASVDVDSLQLIDYYTKQSILSLPWTIWNINDREKICFYELSDLSEGKYYLSFEGFRSNCFEVESDARILEKTALIQYAFVDNKRRTDVATLVNRTRFFFDMRIPGGFMDEDWEFGVMNESFETEDGDRRELMAVDFTDKMLTIGHSDGIPSWIGEAVSRVIGCDYLYIDGIRYTTTDTSRIERVDVSEDRFVYKVQLRECHVSDIEFERKNEIILRRTPTHLRKAGERFRRI